MDPHRQRALAAGHTSIEEIIDELMEAYEADEYEERDGFLYLYRDGEYLTGFERRR